MEGFGFVCWCFLAGASMLLNATLVGLVYDSEAEEM